MNARERMLMIILASVLGGGGVLFVVVQWFAKPLMAARKAVLAAQTEVNNLDEQIFTFYNDQRKMELAKRKSLPTDPQLAASEYMSYLQTVLTDAKLDVEDINHSQSSEFKMSAPMPTGVKKIGHHVITFQVRARGELPALVKAMNVLQRTPFEHRIKTITIDRAEPTNTNSSKLGINMNIETLLVARSESKVGIPPGIDPKYLVLDGIAARQGTSPLGWGLLASMAMLKQAMPAPPDYRLYTKVAGRNIFTDPKRWADNQTEAPEKSIDAPPEFVPQYVRLVMTEPTAQTAYLRNLIFKAPETKLIAKPRSGYEQFRITDEDHEFVYFTGKILRVDPRDIYFQIKDKVYGMHIGQSFADVLGQDLSGQDYLSIFKLDELDIDYDRAWAASQAAAEKTVPTVKRKTPRATDDTAPEKTNKKGGNKKKGKIAG